MNTELANTLLDATIVVLLVVVSVGCAIHALMNKRDPRAAIGWIALCLLAPVFGPLSYWLLGVNRTSRHAEAQARTTKTATLTHFELIGDGPVREPPPPTSGNNVQPMFDAEQSFSAMLQAIDEATQQIWMSQYIFEAAGVGDRFITALINAAGRGVSVHVILDRVGALYSWGSTRRRLQRGGVRVAMFLPPVFRPFAWRLNLRNHRKILVIDHALAFTGGMNIRNGYLAGQDGRPAQIYDTHFACRGPVVEDLARVLWDDWQYASGEHIAQTPAHTTATGNTQCRVTIDGPDNHVDLLTVTIQAAIASATSHVRIMMPYFLPPRELASGLQAAAIRGVAVDIVIPARNNLPFVHWAMMHMFKDLLRYGIRVHCQTGAFNHSKLITIDHDRCLFGSVNIDFRSLRLNFELAIEAWDRALTAALIDHIDARIATADLVTLDGVTTLPAWVRFRNALAWLASPYL
ncbi:MAG: phospholipase D-like domain-containing protein [Pseudomonadota bacterium]